MIHTHGTEYIVEIQNGAESEGMLCCERVVVRVCNDGGGPFLALTTDNLEPTEDHDNRTITISEKDIDGMFSALKEILRRHEK